MKVSYCNYKAAIGLISIDFQGKYYYIKLELICIIGTSLRLSPSGIVSVCPGGQVLLTCKRTPGFILHWNVSVPHVISATTQRIIVPASPGVVLSPHFKIGFTEFNVTRTSSSPLISQLLINNVTAEINGSTIYCSEDGNENNAPMTAIDIKYKGMIKKSDDKLFHNYINY